MMPKLLRLWWRRRMLRADVAAIERQSRLPGESRSMRRLLRVELARAQAALEAL